MARDKEYTEASHPNHRLIKAAKRAGLTGVVFTWRSATSYSGQRGWSLKCDQVPYRRYYQDVPGIVALLRDGMR